MRKYLFIAFLTLCSVCNASYNDYTDVFSISLIGGSIKSNCCNYGGVGASLSVYNVYADVYGLPPLHGSDVRIDRWDDKSCISFHFGYRINLGKYIGITPLIGLSQVSYGETDGYDWYCTSSGIHNEYNVIDSDSNLDYGAMIDANIAFNTNYDFESSRVCMKLGIGVTRHNIFASVGISLNKKHPKHYKTYTTNQNIFGEYLNY